MSFEESQEMSKDETVNLQLSVVKLKTRSDNLEKSLQEYIQRLDKDIEKLKTQQELINRNIANYDTNIEQNSERIEVCFNVLNEKVNKDVHKLCEKGFTSQIDNLKDSIEQDRLSTKNLSNAFKEIVDAKFTIQEKIVRFGWITTGVVIILWAIKAYFTKL